MAVALVKYVTDIYNLIVETGDPRVNHWLLVRTPIPMLVSTIAYLLFIRYGPRAFEGRPPLNAKNLLIWYNFLMVALSVYMLAELIFVAYQDSYGFVCHPLDVKYDPLSMRMADVFWLFYVSKIIELIDTVFLVVMKKNSQLSFLHCYHHATMILSQWIGVKYVPGGRAYLHLLVNCFIHTVMYSYYGLACFPRLRKFLWWKKFLTVLQLTQFIFIIGHVALGVYVDCPNYPHWTGKLILGNCSIYFVLFVNFYIHAYRKTKTSTQIFQNGTAHTIDKKLQ